METLITVGVVLIAAVVVAGALRAIASSIGGLAVNVYRVKEEMEKAREHGVKVNVKDAEDDWTPYTINSTAPVPSFTSELTYHGKDAAKLPPRPG